ncbi:hypothetical protein FA95DRAFT_1684872 [Auriscalpium vulgare]|uniref:Uncharacterized protein n=1 Tax=Auriscalpium vulgare TaxID=40419 RepID=A0ACB8R038_9AGAM|nr:hypothetical protein FA95DRAFT_1684872 [Auriscalpium vulgare]
MSLSVIILFLESMLYGVYTCLFFATVHILYSRRNKGMQIFLVLATVIMYTIACVRVFILVVTQDKGGNDDQLLDAIGIARIIMSGITFVCADAIVAWRAYVIWGRSLRVLIVPVILLIGTTSIVIAEFVFSVIYSNTGNINMALTVLILELAAVAVTLATNFIATVMVAYRAWVHHRASSEVKIRVGRDRSLAILTLLVESGALYCGIWITYLVLLFTAGDGNVALATTYAIFETVVTQLTGIYHTLIIVICSLQVSYMDRMSSFKLDSSSSAVRPSPPSKVSYPIPPRIYTNTNASFSSIPESAEMSEKSLSTLLHSPAFSSPTSRRSAGSHGADDGLQVRSSLARASATPSLPWLDMDADVEVGSPISSGGAQSARI